MVLDDGIKHQNKRCPEHGFSSLCMIQGCDFGYTKVGQVGGSWPNIALMTMTHAYPGG